MLTQKQENFTLDLFKGLSETESYRNNYNTANMSIGAVWVEACRLTANPKVSLRLKELREPAVNSTKMLVGEREERLSKIAREDVESDKGVPLRRSNITAIAELNKMDHLYTDSPTYQDNRVVNIIVSDKEAKELTEGVEGFGIFNWEKDVQT